MKVKGVGTLNRLRPEVRGLLQENHVRVLRGDMRVGQDFGNEQFPKPEPYTPG